MSEPSAEVAVFDNAAELLSSEAERLTRLIEGSVAERGRCTVALAGGSTPRGLYERLSRPHFAPRIDWSRVHVFWGDERCVPPDHPESNYRMAREALLDRVPIPAANVHRIRGEEEPERAAEEYEQLLHEFFGPAGGAPDRSFDIVLLGMGPDGHTASLFPGEPAATEEHRWVMAQKSGLPPFVWRVTLTPVVINSAADITFLVIGANKAEPLAQVLGDSSAPPLPARRIVPRKGSLHWMLDAAAAARLGRGGTQRQTVAFKR